MFQHQYKKSFKGTHWVFPQDCHPCNALLFVNLAQPEWMNLKCNESLSRIILCTIPKKNSSDMYAINLAITPSFAVCKKGLILWKKDCLKFQQYESNYFTPRIQERPDIEEFKNIIDLIYHTQLPPVFFNDFTSYTTITKHLNKLVFKTEQVRNNPLQGLYLSAWKKVSIDVGNNLLQCKNDTFVTIVYSESSTCFQQEILDKIDKENSRVLDTMKSKTKTSCSTLFYTA